MPQNWVHGNDINDMLEYYIITEPYACTQKTNEKRLCYAILENINLDHLYNSHATNSQI